MYFVGRMRIPVSRVIVFDKTAENALGEPYMIQNRIEGRTFLSCYLTLSHSQKMRIARELGYIFREMVEMRSTMAGRLVLDGEDGETRVVPFRITKDNHDNGAASGDSEQPQQTPLEWLSAVFTARQATDPSDTLLARFDQMAHEFDADGFFS